MADWILFPDEYSGDADLTDYVELVKHTPTIGQKAGEGIGSYPWFPAHAARARMAGLLCGAYFWPLIRENGALQAQQFVTNAPAADWYAADLEEGRVGAHSYNGDAPRGAILDVMHAFFDAFHAVRPTKPLLLYGAAFMAAKGITWTDLVGDRDWIWAWLPRYSGGGDISTWTLPQVLVYAEPSRYGVPPSRVAVVQFTNGSSGPAPHTLPGLNRDEDMNVLVVPIEQLLGQEDDMAVFDDIDQGSRDQRAGVAIPKGASRAYKYGWYLEQRVAAAASKPGPGSGATKTDLSKHAADGEAHHHGHLTGLPQAP